MSEFIGGDEADALNLSIRAMPPEEVLRGISFQPDPLDAQRYIIPDGKRGVVSVSEAELMEMGRQRRFAELYGGTYAVRAAQFAAFLEKDAATRTGEWVAA